MGTYLYIYIRKGDDWNSLLNQQGIQRSALPPLQDNSSSTSVRAFFYLCRSPLIMIKGSNISLLLLLLLFYLLSFPLFNHPRFADPFGANDLGQFQFQFPSWGALSIRLFSYWLSLPHHCFLLFEIIPLTSHVSMPRIVVIDVRFFLIWVSGCSAWLWLNELIRFRCCLCHGKQLWFWTSWTVRNRMLT